MQMAMGWQLKANVQSAQPPVRAHEISKNPEKEKVIVFSRSKIRPVIIAAADAQQWDSD